MKGRHGQARNFNIRCSKGLCFAREAAPPTEPAESQARARGRQLLDDCRTPRETESRSTLEKIQQNKEKGATQSPPDVNSKSEFDSGVERHQLGAA